MVSVLPTIQAVLRFKSGKKTLGRPLYGTSSLRLWVLLDEAEPDFSNLEWIALTNQIQEDNSYDKREAAAVVVLDRLCLLKVERAFSKYSLPVIVGRPPEIAVTNAYDLLTDPGEQSANTLANVLRHLDPAIADDASSAQLADLLRSYSLAEHLARLGDPTKLVFERGDSLVRDLETHLLRVPLTFLIGGASAGRTALSAVLGNQRGRFKYLAKNNVSSELAKVAEEVEVAYAKTGTLHRSELATLLTALVLAVLQQEGVAAGTKAFRGANAAGAQEPMRAFAQYIVARLRTEAGDPAEMLAVFFRLLAGLVKASAGDDVTTVLLPFEQLEQEWTKHSYPRLWGGLKTLAHDLDRHDRNDIGRVRLLVMARSVPFNDIGKPGLSTWVLAMPPLDHSETKTRLTELTGAPVTDDAVADVLAATGGMPILTAALFHAIDSTAQLSVGGVATARNRVLNELKNISAKKPVDTASGRLLRRFINKVKLTPGDEEFYVNWAGGQAFLDDDLSHAAFRRLFAAGLIWFQPNVRCKWSALKNGAEFNMAPASDLVLEILDSLSLRGSRSLVTQ